MNIICISCESEFIITELESDYKVSICPYCGETLDIEHDDDE